jgi:hypothetical protein
MDNGLDILSILSILERRKGTYLSLLLDDLELLYKKGDPQFADVRKLVLDYFNDYYRSLIKVVTDGDIE